MVFVASSAVSCGFRADPIASAVAVVSSRDCSLTSTFERDLQGGAEKSGAYTGWPIKTYPTGNENMPIQLAQCRFPGLAISTAKILIYFSNKIYGSNFIKQHSETVMV